MITKYAHTPGPWRTNEDQTMVIAGSRGLHIATVATTGMPNAEANARLLAAAPAMLEALQFAAIGLQDCGYHETAKVCRAAITQATKDMK